MSKDVLVNRQIRFYTKDELSVWTNLGKHFVVRLVMRLKCKDGRETHYASRRTTSRSASFKTYYEVLPVKRLVPP